MFDADRFNKVIKNRVNLDPNNDPARCECWEELVAIAVDDIEGLIAYIQEQITVFELYWFSEVYEEVVEATQSVAFLDAIVSAAERIADPVVKASILQEVEDARGYLYEEGEWEED